MENYMLPCMNKYFFGIDCPGCGIQRAISFLFQGDFVAAFEIFPAIYPMFFFILSLGLHFADKSRSYHFYINFFAILSAAVIAVFYVYRIFTNQLF